MRIPGQAVHATLVPADDQDTYAVTDAKYAKGGFRTVATLAERNEITVERREIGMRVHVTDAQPDTAPGVYAEYVLVSGITNDDWERDTAVESAAAAAASAAAAAASALSASNSESTATAQAAIATAQSTNASVSAAAALASEQSASGDAAAALADRLVTDANVGLANAAATTSGINAANSQAYTPNRGLTLRAMNTAALPASTLSLDGLTLTFTAQAPVSNTLLDNITSPIAGDLIGYWDQTGNGGADAKYGPWVIATRGVAATTQEVWTRPAATNTAAELGFACWPVQSTANGGGTIYGTDGGKVFRVTNDPTAVVLGTTPLQVGLVGSINGGSGNGVRLTKLEAVAIVSFQTEEGPTYPVIVVDAGGRTITTVPDPRVDTLVSSSPTVSFFQREDDTVLLITADAGGRTISTISAGSDASALSVATAAEVTAARGNDTSLSAHLLHFLTADGAPIINPYHPEYLRQTHYRLVKRKLPTPEAVQLVINLCGDSYTHNPSRYSGPLMDYLAAEFGDAGGGWCGFGFLQSGNVAPWSTANQPNFINGNVRPATYPTRHIGNAAGTYYTAAMPDLALATLSTSGDKVLQAFPAAPVHNACDLLFSGTADGVIRYSWGTYNGSGNVDLEASYTFGSTTNLNVQGTVGATQSVSLATGMPSGQGMLKIEWVAGSCKLGGVNLKSAANGVRVNKLGATGSAASQWSAAPATQWEAGVAALGSHLTCYMDGTNSQTNSVSAADWGAQIANIVTRFRSATPGTDLLLATPPENQRTTNTVPMTAYATEGRRQAQSLRLAFTDTQGAFGDPAFPLVYGSSGAVPLFNADLIHPEPLTGGRLLLAEFLNAILPF